MLEAVGNIWDLAQENDVIIITTNGDVKNNGEAVMGRGIALEAKERDRFVSHRLGRYITEEGNHVGRIHLGPPAWYSFPVKHHWRDAADPELIRRSAYEIAAIALTGDKLNAEPYENWYLPRPGCGNGRLLWEDVKPIIAPILDDRFIVCTI